MPIGPVLKFAPGDRVLVSGAAGWPKDAVGTITPAHSAVLPLSGAWIGGIARYSKWATHPEPVLVYWVVFDEPQRDSNGDGPYRAGSVEEAALRIQN